MVKQKPKSFLTKKRQRDGGKGDFKRPKQKVGRKLKPANVTNTNFKTAQVRLSDQRSLADKTASVVTRKRRDLQDLLSHIKHYDPSRRKDALWGIRELYLTHGNQDVTLQRSLGVLFKTILDRMVDTEKQVREALYTLLEVLLPFVKESASNVATTFVRRLVAYCGSAMTSMEKGVMLDAVRYVKLLLEWNCAALQREEFISQLIPSLTAVMNSISIVKSASTLTHQSYSVLGNESKKQLKKTTLANQRIFDVLSTIDLLLQPSNNAATHQNSQTSPQPNSKPNSHTNSQSNSTNGSSVLHFLNVNEMLASSSSSSSLLDLENSASSVIDFTTTHATMIQELMSTMSTIWCDLYEMMVSDSSTGSKMIHFNSMSIVLNIITSIHNMILSSKEKNILKENDEDDDDVINIIFQTTLLKFNEVYSTIASNYPILGNDARSRSLNVHLTHVLLQVATTVKGVSNLASGSSFSSSSFSSSFSKIETTISIENECYNYICNVLSNVECLNSMPKTTLGNVLKVVEFMVTDLEALELYCCNNKNHRSTKNHKSKKMYEKLKKLQKKRTKVVMAALTEWYQSCTVEQIHKMNMFHTMVLRLLQRPALWWTHHQPSSSSSSSSSSSTSSSSQNVFIIELKLWISKYPQRIWQLINNDTKQEDEEDNSRTDASNIIYDMLKIMSIASSKSSFKSLTATTAPSSATSAATSATTSSHLISVQLINQISFLFWMKMKSKKNQTDDSKENVVWGSFCNGHFDEPMQKAVIDLLYHLPLITPTLRLSLFHVLRSNQLSYALTSRLLSVLHHHHYERKIINNNENNENNENNDNENDTEMNDPHSVFLLDLVLGQSNESVSGQESTIIRPTQIYMFKTVVSFLAISCMNEQSKSLIVERTKAFVLQLFLDSKITTHGEPILGCLMMIRTFDIDVTDDVLSNVLEHALEMSVTIKSLLMFQEILLHFKLKTTIMVKTLEKLTDTNNVVNEKDEIVANRLNGVHEMIKIMNDQVAELLRNNALDVLISHIQSIQNKQTIYSGIANRIWSQLLQLGMKKK